MTKLNISPTWQDIARTAIVALKDGDERGQAQAEEIIMDMADKLQMFVEKLREAPEIASQLGVAVGNAEKKATSNKKAK